ERLQAPDRALADWRMLTRIAPESPQALEASYQIGQALAAQGDIPGAYRAYRFIEEFCLRAARDPRQPFRTRDRQSRFFSWDHALGLYPDALANAVLLYGRATRRLQAEGEAPPRGVFLLDSKRPLLEEPLGKTPSLFLDTPNGTDWREETYAVIAPPGYEATGVSMELTGRLLVLRTDRDFTMRIYPFPMPRDPQQGWIGVLYGQTAETQTLRKTVSFHGENRRLFTLQLIESQGEIVHWKLGVRLKPVSRQAQRPSENAVRDEAGFWEGKPLAELRLPSEIRTSATRNLTRA